MPVVKTQKACNDFKINLQFYIIPFIMHPSQILPHSWYFFLLISIIYTFSYSSPVPFPLHFLLTLSIIFLSFSTISKFSLNIPLPMMLFFLLRKFLISSSVFFSLSFFVFWVKDFYTRLGVCIQQNGAIEHTWTPWTAWNSGGPSPRWWPPRGVTQ